MSKMGDDRTLIRFNAVTRSPPPIRRKAMRKMSENQNSVVSVLQAYNFVGSRKISADWDETEAFAIRLGQRAKAASEVRGRGLEALRLMIDLAESGVIEFIYTDDERRRIRYSQSTGFWLTAIYPDPTGTGEGMIELDDRYLHPCVVDVGQILHWRLQNNAPKTGPKRGFLQFDAALDRYFVCNPTSTRNADVICDLGKDNPKLIWPGKTTMHERINDARDRANGNSVGFNSEQNTERSRIVDRCK